METTSEKPLESSKAMESSSSEDKVETRNWCDLPKEALVSVVLHLDWHTHLTRLRGVCPAWRSSLPRSNFPILTSIKVPPLEPNLPYLFLLLNRFYLLSPLPSNQDGCYSPLDGRWLARMGEMGLNTWHLFDPLNIHEYFFSTPPISGSINLLDCQVLELAQVFSLIDGGREAKSYTKKIVGGLNMDSSHHFAVLAQLERAKEDCLVLLRLGDPQWIRIQETKELRIFDIASHKGKFYAFDLSNWRIGLIDPANPLSPMEFICAPDILSDPIDGKFTLKFNGCSYFLRGLYLVPSNGRLYLVVEVEGQSDPEKVTLIVFVLKESEKEEERDNNNWEHVNSLGDQIFFIGYDTSFSLPSSSINLPQWKPSSICLFTRPFPLIFDGCDEDGSGRMPEGVELLESVTYAEYWRYLRIFDMGEHQDQERGVVPFEMLPKRLYTGLFFPPPAWVKWQCPSLDNLEVRLDGLKFRDENYQTYSD